MSTTAVSTDYIKMNKPLDFGPEARRSMFLRNVGIYLKVHTRLQLKRPTPTILVLFPISSDRRKL